MSFVDSIKRNGDNIELYKYDVSELDQIQLNEDDYPDNVIKICFLDVETTGTEKTEDKIIELALKLVAINQETGEIVDVPYSYESFEDPGEPINEEVSLINGITDDMVSGESINWTEVEKIFDISDLIVAHNASFDRAFLDRYLPVSLDKMWACSMLDVDWLQRGFTNKKQELLCIWHGFFYESHRAMNDVDALIHLVTHPHYDDNKPILEIIANVNIPYYKIIARDCPYDLKDKVKANKYWWNRDGKYWWKKLAKEEIEEEKQWLMENIYQDHFLGIIEEIPLIDKYKD